MIAMTIMYTLCESEDCMQLNLLCAVKAAMYWYAILVEWTSCVQS